MHRRTNLDSASDEKHQQSPPKPGQVNVHKLLTFGVVFIVGAVLFLVAPGAREPLASQAGCNNNLKQIGIALHNYHDIWRCFPSPHSTDADGKPLHSWRVAIEASTLDSRFDFTLRWNHPRNLMASDPVPYHFKCPRAPQSKGTAFTNYVMVVGQKRRAPSGQEISFDQHSDAIIVVEIADSDIHWTEPRELNFDEMSFKINDKTKPSISSHHVHGAMVLYADGSVHFLNESTNPKELRKLLTENLQDGSGRSQADVPATCDG